MALLKTTEHNCLTLKVCVVVPRMMKILKIFSNLGCVHKKCIFCVFVVFKLENKFSLSVSQENKYRIYLLPTTTTFISKHI